MAALGKCLTLLPIAGTVSDLMNINCATYVTQAQTPQQPRATVLPLKEEGWLLSLWDCIKFVQVYHRLQAVLTFAISLQKEM